MQPVCFKERQLSNELLELMKHLQVDEGLSFLG